MSDGSTREMSYRWPDYTTFSASRWAEDVEAGAIGGHRD